MSIFDSCKHMLYEKKGHREGEGGRHHGPAPRAGRWEGVRQRTGMGEGGGAQKGVSRTPTQSSCAWEAQGRGILNTCLSLPIVKLHALLLPTFALGRRPCSQAPPPLAARSPFRFLKSFPHLAFFLPPLVCLLRSCKTASGVVPDPFKNTHQPPLPRKSPP